jgi:hypothetical protein
MRLLRFHVMCHVANTCLRNGSVLRDAVLEAPSIKYQFSLIRPKDDEFLARLDYMTM